MIVGPVRTTRRNWQLAALLAAVAGILNSVGFVAVALYTSHMTGVTAALADSAVIGEWDVVALAAGAIVAFLAGAMACAVVFNWCRRRELHGRYAAVLAIEAALILLVGLLADRLDTDLAGWRTVLIVVVLCFTMGLQNALITKISGAQIRTTHVTGMITDIGIELGKLGYRSRRDGHDPVRGDRRKLALLTSLVGLFTLGGMVGAAGYLTFGFAVLIPVAVVLLVAAVPPLRADWRARRA
ncbi:YoaK family protein [Nocardioides massiliensis]|uniref:Uncharacterized membrane protein YoaK (UPF0700 family) n=1 Tax=Nocardioides massiliensis TaxID=1325935 RepID=A0ABT9NKH8_9ACTN|nr:YoaK family protein [Nocardioides massiliensis]MDP9820560.1 uncharacterized membrane protein YoaK (UPF0700 family) [Nocardioides massiliensis]